MKTFTRFIALSAMMLLAVSTAFAQGQGGSNYPSTTHPTKGEDWEIIEYGGKQYTYFKGNDKIDGFKTSERKMLGFHWKGHTVSEVESDTLYLCNVATGEYMQIGEYWGETGMINHVGLAYKLKKGYSQRKNQSVVFPGWSEEDGYFIQPLGVRENRVIGRMNRNDGKLGHFEYNKFLAMRDMDEYDDGYGFNPLNNTWDDDYDPGNPATLWRDEQGKNPGGFLFQFYSVEGEKGEQEYIIYTHRKTDIYLNQNGRYNPLKDNSEYQYKQRSEYYDRDSYLLLTNAGPLTADYNSVRFVKFAGQMYGADKPTVAIAQKGTGITTLGSFSPSNDAARTFTANLALSDGTTVPVTVTADGAFMGVSNATSSTNNDYHNPLAFYPTDGNVHTITVSAPEDYVIKNYSFNGVTGTSDRKFIVKAGDVTKKFTAPDRTEITKDNLNSRTMTFTIQVDPEATNFSTANGLYLVNFNVVLERTGGNDSNVVPLYNNSDMNNSLGDEVEHYNNGKYFISLETGLKEAAKDKNNRWKLVTKAERDKFRLVASEEQPLDASSRITNPKFYTSFQYNWSAAKCDGPDGDGHYTHTSDKTTYGWQWFDEDRTTHPDKHHVHPYDIDYSDYENNKKEHHKVGTGHFWRTGSEGLEIGNGGQEFQLTYGQEANYSGSIFKGTANIQQTIKNLREGLYVVYVRGFYAPHDMTKYTIEDWSTPANDRMDGNPVSSEAPSEWRDQAYYMEGGKRFWHRSHDSYLFAWSYPKGKKGKNEQGQEIDLPAEEVRRMLPSIYEGAIRMDHLGKISRAEYMASDGFQYTQLGNWYVNQKDANNNDASADFMTQIQKRVDLMLDTNIFARYEAPFFNGTGSGENWNWVVPKSITGAARFFNAVDETDITQAGESHKNAGKYRIGLPVYVGSDGTLTIGVDHTQASESNPDEWVCFDDFELLYLGKVEPDEFVIDELEGTKQVGPFQKVNGETGKIIEGEYYSETKMKNNTQWIDLFDPTDLSNAEDQTKIKKVKKVVLRRTMPVKGWSSVVMPVSLTLKHVKEMFGEDANVSKLDRFEERTIHYKNQLEGKGENDIVMQAGVPYIVRPSQDPIIPAGSEFKYNRPAFTKAYSTSIEGVAGYFLKNETRNSEVERNLDGPIWVATDVDIYSHESFPDIEYLGAQNYRGDGSIWTAISGYTKDFVVAGTEEGYTMVETGVYEPSGYIPAYSYYHAGGKMYYTKKAVGPLPRGLYSYIQMISKKDGQAYAKPFIGGDDIFIEVLDEPTGIEDINRPLPDGKIEIYDLQGRKVTNPGRGIYIMNGQKVLFK